MQLFQIIYSYSRAEKATPNQTTTGCCCCGDAKDVVNLVDDHVPDGVDEEVLQQAPLQHLQLPALLIGLGRSRAGQHSKEIQANNQQSLDHIDQGQAFD